MSLIQNWESNFTEREQQEIALARFYACNFAHGTTGHSQLLIIAKMSSLLNLTQDGFIFEYATSDKIQAAQSEEVKGAIEKAREIRETELSSQSRRRIFGGRFA